MDKAPHIRILDLKFSDTTSSIAAFLIESNDGLVLIETGPESTFGHLKEAIRKEGFDWKNVKHVLLTHIHFDHAGAAWEFAQNGADIYVHPIGLPHLNDPERLWNSAKMIYGNDMDRLWGSMQPIGKKLLVAANDGDALLIGNLEFRVHYTPGHAIHHNAYQLGSVIFTGDVAGIRINNGPVTPPCPPPDINLSHWKTSIQTLKDLNAEALYLTHFGIVENPGQHLTELKSILDEWANRIKPYYDAKTPPEKITPEFIRYTERQLKDAGVSDDDIIRYDKANPPYMSVTGLLRYWKLKEQGRI